MLECCALQYRPEAREVIGLKRPLDAIYRPREQIPESCFSTNGGRVQGVDIAAPYFHHCIAQMFFLLSDHGRAHVTNLV